MEFSHERNLKALRLVAETLLVTVGAHALLAFMFVDFGLTTFFKGTHRS